MSKKTKKRTAKVKDGQQQQQSCKTASPPVLQQESGKSHLFVFCLGHTTCHKIKIYDCPMSFANQVEIICYSGSRESSAPS